MGTLKLRNCTRFQLAYWRQIAFHRTSYVSPGHEGTYVWHATYTLKAMRADTGKGENKRDAVNENGIYYAYWQNGRVDILDEYQIQGVSRDDDNPWVEKWISPVIEQQEFPVLWELRMSRRNTSPAPLTFDFTEKWGFESVHSDTHRLRVTDTQQTGVNFGAGFTYEGASITGGISSTTTHAVEDFTEEMSKETVYGDEQRTLHFTLEPEDSIAVWQPYVNIWGNRMFLDHLSYTRVDDPPPDDPTFEKATVKYLLS